jgi:ATP/maltotriose-dependent transcriptional regulator MalT/two-component SAPR family response regulator
MNNKRAPPAKVCPPRQRKVHPRLRLFDRLDEARRSPCVWVSGPPGSGKTTLVGSYVGRDRGRPTIWYQVDGGDRDIASLYHYLGAALDDIAPGAGERLPRYSSAFVREPDAFNRKFFERFFDALQPPFVLVFDNYHFVDDVPEFHRALTMAIDSLPAGCNIFLVSRRPTPAGLSRLIANEQLDAVGWPDLKMTALEVRDIAEKHGFVDLGDNDLAALERVSAGWVAGVILLLRANELDPLTIDFEQTQPQALFDYFAQEIFSRHDAHTQNFLMQAALLPAISEQVTIELSGSDRYWHALFRLHERNYFIDYHPNPKPLLQFHPLFREFLLNQLDQRLTPDEIRDAKRTAGKIAATVDDVEVAVELLTEAGDYRRVYKLICENVQTMLSHGRVNTIDRWITSLPPDELARFPRLEYWLAICRLFDSPPEAIVHFESSFAGCNEKSDATGAQLAWAGAVYAILISWTAFQRLEEWLTQGEKLVAEHPDFASQQIENTFTYAMCLAKIFSQPADSRTDALVERTLEIMRRPQSLTQQLLTGNILLQHFTWMGAMAKGRILSEILESRVDQGDPTDDQQISWLAAKAQFAMATGNVEAAIRRAQHGIALSRDSGVCIWQHKLIGVAAQSNLLLARNDEARECLQTDAATLPAPQNLLWFHHHWLFAWCEWQSGRTQDAFERMAAAEQTLEIGGWPTIPMAKYHVGMAILHFESGNDDTARKHVDEANRIARRVDSNFLRHQCAVIEALFALDANDDSCIGLGRAAMEIGESADILVIDWLDRGRMSRLCGRLLSEGVCVDHVRRLVRAQDLEAPDGSGPTENWPWPVKIYALGGCRILRDGKAISQGTTRQKKVVELLKALIALGGERVSEAVLTDAIWPDSEADAAHNSLKTSVHRLRQLLGRADAIEIAQGTISLNRACCWVDAWEVDTLLSSAPKSHDRLDRLRRGIELYRGDLFSADDEAWALTHREKLRGKVRDAVCDLGRYWEQLEEWQTAIDAYEAGIALDEYSETLYRRLMVCHDRLGRYADAMIIYEQCRERLDRKLGVSPSRITRALAEEIRHH